VNYPFNTQYIFLVFMCTKVVQKIIFDINFFGFFHFAPKHSNSSSNSASSLLAELKLNLNAGIENIKKRKEHSVFLFTFKLFQTTLDPIYFHCIIRNFRHFSKYYFLFVPQTKRKSEKIQWSKMFYSCYYLQMHINTNPLCNDTCDRENIDMWYLV